MTDPGSTVRSTRRSDTAATHFHFRLRRLDGRPEGPIEDRGEPRKLPLVVPRQEPQGIRRGRRGQLLEVLAQDVDGLPVEVDRREPVAEARDPGLDPLAAHAQPLAQPVAQMVGRRRVGLPCQRLQQGLGPVGDGEAQVPEPGPGGDRRPALSRVIGPPASASRTASRSSGQSAGVRP
jgi:hypothetical protein